MRALMKLALLAVVVTLATGAFAQTFAVKGGLNLSTMVMKDNDDTYSDDLKLNPGFHAGITAEFPIAGVFSLETGALLSTRGFRIQEKETFEGGPFEIKETMNLYYLEVPVTGKFTFDAGGVKINGAIGPYVGVGLTGNVKAKASYQGETEKDEAAIHWGSDEENDDFLRGDFGVTIGGGVEINAFRVGVSYALGLANISPNTEDGFTMSNNVLGLSVGYVFFRNK